MKNGDYKSKAKPKKKKHANNTLKGAAIRYQISRGLTDAEIIRTLGVSGNSVKYYRNLKPKKKKGEIKDQTLKDFLLEHMKKQKLSFPKLKVK